MSKVRIEEVVKGRSCGADPLLEPALGSGHQEASRETFGCTHRPSTAVSDHAADHTVDLSSQVGEAVRVDAPQTVAEELMLPSCRRLAPRWVSSRLLP